MPKLVRLYIASVVAGFALAVVFVALLLALDVAGLRHLVLETQGGWLGGLLLVVFNGIVFAGVQFGIRIMRMAEPEDEPPTGRRHRATPALGLAEVAIPVHRRR